MTDAVEKSILILMICNPVLISRSWRVVIARQSVTEESFSHRCRRRHPREPFFNSIGQRRGSPAGFLRPPIGVRKSPNSGHEVNHQAQRCFVPENCRRRRKLTAVSSTVQPCKLDASWSNGSETRPASANAFKGLIRRPLEQARIPAAGLEHSPSSATHDPGSGGGSRPPA